MSKLSLVSNRNLSDLADDINIIVKNIHTAEKKLNDGRVAMGHILIEVRERIVLSKESNMSFEQWCHENLRKHDGLPFSFITIKNYMRFARCPNSLAADRKQKKEYQKKARDAYKNSIQYKKPGFTEMNCGGGG